MKSLFSGVATALITPFCNGEIDFGSLETILNRQREAGIPAVVLAGTTGESPALTYEEFDSLIRFTRARWDRVLIAGCGANCTDRAVELGERAVAAGADALLAVTPYYNKASRAGLLAHYREICRLGKPVIVYHVPSRTGMRLSMGDFHALAELDGICGIKECTGDLAFLHELAAVFGDRWSIWTGNDDNIRPSMRLGASGVISVVSNVLPRETAELTAQSAKVGNPGAEERSRQLHLALEERIASLFCEVNPIPVKYVASKAGLCRAEYRLPLTPPNPRTRQLLDRLWGG